MPSNCWIVPVFPKLYALTRERDRCTKKFPLVKIILLLYCSYKIYIYFKDMNQINFLINFSVDTKYKI